MDKQVRVTNREHCGEGTSANAHMKRALDVALENRFPSLLKRTLKGTKVTKKRVV